MFSNNVISQFNVHDCIQEGRMLVSTDTELNWLSLFSNLSSPSHQLVGVPVFEDGGNCGLYGGGGRPVRESQKNINLGSGL